MNDTSCVLHRQRRRAAERACRKQSARAPRGKSCGQPFAMRLMPLLVLLAASEALALPVGGQVVSGSVTLGTPSNNALSIQQNSGSAIVNWNGFSINGNETVNIKQPNVNSVMLNRVLGNNASVIAGHLTATGKVFLVNPAGVLFAPGASINVGSLVASTLGISNADFLAGNYHFTAAGQQGGSVVNQGAIQATSGGTVALLGAQVDNSGTVSAKLGTVALGAGGDITLDFAGDGLTMLKINGPAAQALVQNSGTLAADGGQVLMSVQSADALAATVLNQTGIVQAQSLAERNGHIVLDGGPQGVTLVSGSVAANGGTGLSGGQIDVTGQDVALLSGAMLNASGATGGGRVRFGGGPGGTATDIRNAEGIWMAPGAQIHADALANGPGGQIVAYGEQTARLYGTLSAQGGPQGGSGGSVETSGGYLDVNGAQVNVSGANGAAGTWLLDPYNATITADSSTDTLFNGAFNSGATTSTISTGTIDYALDHNVSVTISTVQTTPSGGEPGDIIVNGPILKDNGSRTSLTLEASGSITMNNRDTPSITDEPLNGNTPGPLDITLIANGKQVTDGSAKITISSIAETLAGPTLATNGGNVVIGVPYPGGTISPQVLLTNVKIDTRAISTELQPIPNAASGSITIHGASPVSTGVYLEGVTMNTTNAPIDIEGTALVNANSTPALGVEMIGNAAFPTSINSTSGNIQIFGSGHILEGIGASGLSAAAPATITTNTGTIDLRAVSDGVAATGSSGDTYFSALEFDNVNVTANGIGQILVTASQPSAQSAISLTGSKFSTTGLPGGAAPNGMIVLRAANDGSASPFSVDAASSIAAINGTLVFVPGSVDPTTFAVLPNNGTSTNVFSGGAGFSLPQALFNIVSTQTANLIIGSPTQVGRITLNAGCETGGATCAPNTASFDANVTLDNSGAGSQGISLPVGAKMVGELASTFTLASTGASSANAPISTDYLVLDGLGTFALGGVPHQVNVLGMVGAGTVVFSNAGDLEINGTESYRFNNATNTLVPILSNESTPTANVTITTTATPTSSGNIDVLGPILKNAGGDATLSLNAAGSIYFSPSSAKSSSGALNITLNAANLIDIGSNNDSSTDRVQIWTNGGNFTAGTLNGTASGFDDAAVNLDLVDIDTRVGVTGGTPGATGGAVTLHGFNKGASLRQAALDFNSASIVAASGNVDLQGQSGVQGTIAGRGVVIENDLSFDADPASSITTTTGRIGIFGSATGAGNSGVDLLNGSTIRTTAGGTVDIRGAYAGASTAQAPALDVTVAPQVAPQAVASQQSDSYGVLLANGSVSASGTGSEISITGSTVTGDAGIGIGAVPLSTEWNLASGPVSIGAGPQGVILLQSFNNGTATSLLSRSAVGSLSSLGGTAILTGASVDPASFAVTPQNNVPITLFGSAATPGLSIDPTTYQTLSNDLNTLVLGSSTQVASITVQGTCAGGAATCAQFTRPTVATNLTLDNPALGGQADALPYGVSLSGKTLAFVTSAPPTDPNGIQAAGLLLDGPATSFTLTDPGNDIGTLAIPGAQNVTFSQPGSFTIGPLSAQTFDRATGGVTTINATNSTLSGSLQASSTIGGITLGKAGTSTGIDAQGTIDLVMEAGEFDNVGGGTLSAGNAWHIWEASWQGETRGGLNPGGPAPNYYGCIFPGTCSWGGTVPLASNHFVYVAQPTLTVTVGNASRAVGATNPSFSDSVSGLVAGDASSSAVTGGPLSTTATTASPVGNYPITGSFTSSVGYKVAMQPGTLTVVPVTNVPLPPPGGAAGTTSAPASAAAPAPLPLNGRPFDRSGLQPLFTAQEQSFVYESNLGGINVCVGSDQPLLALQQPEGAADTLAVEWKRVRSRPNLNSCLVVNGQHGCDEF
ncbi:filamentous hemagglutinin N-terminal domain-containing protein [Paraburkholderia sp. DHOC27]|uniref:two-partner secretion domain-containing protein n=1 Tax=Paraburkholderia sp. DHOC27 TaxID=2303330 RepID=UPI000E3C7228|nr:filamentous hemagglutinin N-terminal domain-containing protein [Paraburkholderia sp. DHOC27]RFU48326.1 filamentous hemagglutinin N-terminal domain-containing protein [Paraburkholderia sp. DHOC27]